MSDTINAIRGLLNLPRLSKFYAEAKLDDGRLVVTEADSMAIGVEIKVMNDAGEAADLEDGTYTLEDGTKITIAEGRIAELGDASAEEVVAEEEPVTEEALSEEEETALSESEEKILREELEEVVDEQTMEKILNAIKKMNEHEEELEEEEKVEMSHAFAAELKLFAEEVSQVFDVVLSRIEKLEASPASEGVQVSPNRRAQFSAPQEKAINPMDRAKQIIETFKSN